MGFILYLIGIVITYFIIKFAVKDAIKESLEDIRCTVKEAIAGGLYEHERRNRDK
jgi:hypothetical protein